MLFYFMYKTNNISYNLSAKLIAGIDPDVSYKQNLINLKIKKKFIFFITVNTNNNMIIIIFLVNLKLTITNNILLI